jgi:hypothetical protein
MLREASKSLEVGALKDIAQDQQMENAALYSVKNQNNQSDRDLFTRTNRIRLLATTQNSVR